MLEQYKHYWMSKFERSDFTVGEMDGRLSELFRTFADQYAKELAEARETENYKRPFGALVRQNIANKLQEHLDGNIYKVKGSVGAGRWTDVPWIAVFDKRITKSAQKGVYIVYLLNKDTKELYLTLNQGATDVAQSGGSNDAGKLAFTGIASSSNDKTTASLKKRAGDIRATLNNTNKLDYGEISTGSKAYDAGCIFFRKYTVNEIPDDDILYRDLEFFVDAYRQYYEKHISDDTNDTSGAKTGDGEEKMSESERIDFIKRYIESKGFSYENGLIENFYLCLKTKPFVILAGTSGTGKTKLVKLFAEAIGAEYKMVSVRPDWSDSSDLFGHTDLQGNFVSGAITDYVKKAIETKEKPFFLCLDEMNLARVEYYFSDYLSLIETRNWDNGHIVTDIINLDEAAEEKYGNLYLPENLYFIGTVNMDETTYPFSKKVLDRANTIDFSDVNMIPSFEIESEELVPMDMDNDLLISKYLTLISDININQEQLVLKVCSELQEINGILRKANLHVGYRVRDEIVFYMLNNEETNLLSYEEAIDFEIMQKILPRIQGGTQGIKDLIVELFKKCAGDYSSFSQDRIWLQMMDYLKNKASVYPKSAEKICYMMRRFEEDGFTSYWL